MHYAMFYFIVLYFIYIIYILVYQSYNQGSIFFRLSFFSSFFKESNTFILININRSYCDRFGVFANEISICSV